MKHPSRLAVAVLISVTFGLPTATRLLADDSGVALPVAEARARLDDAHRTLFWGVQSVNTAQKKVDAGDERASAELRRYLQRHWSQMAAVVGLEKELSSIEASADASRQMHFLERVNRAHLAALRLRSELESSAPPGAGVPECLGSISGNVQGPGGPVANIMVEAYLAAGGSEGFGLTDISGNYQIDSLPVGDYYVVTSNLDGLIDEVYNNVDCPGGACDPTIGSAVNVSPGATTQGVDFTLAAGGRIGGALVGLPGPIPLVFTTVNIFNAAGEMVTSTTSDFGGLYLTETGLPDGNYRAVTANIFGNLDELYNDIPCAAGVDCDPASGTAIPVTAPNTTSGIDFELGPGGSITGTITDGNTTLPIENVFVGIRNSSGALITFGGTDATGSYMTLGGLATGNYFAVTRNLEGYVDEIYDDIPCTGGFCVVTIGTQIPVTAGATTPNIDFDLTSGGSFSGTVTKTADGDPIADVSVLGYTASGAFVGAATTDTVGQYTLSTGLETASYRATTLNSYGYDDELYDDMSCPFSFCDVTVGTPIPVTIGLDTPGIDIDLAGDSIASCDFEGCSTCDLDLSP